MPPNRSAAAGQDQNLKGRPSRETRRLAAAGTGASRFCPIGLPRITLYAFLMRSDDIDGTPEGMRWNSWVLWQVLVNMELSTATGRRVANPQGRHRVGHQPEVVCAIAALNIVSSATHIGANHGEVCSESLRIICRPLGALLM